MRPPGWVEFVGYVRALNQIMAPFSKPPASLTDYACAARKLRSAISQLGTLTPPPQFAASPAHLVAGLRAQAALAPRFARASTAHDSVALSNLEARLLGAEGTIRTANRELVTVYNECRSASLRTCARATRSSASPSLASAGAWTDERELRLIRG